MMLQEGIQDNDLFSFVCLFAFYLMTIMTDDHNDDHYNYFDEKTLSIATIFSLLNIGK